MSSAPGGPFSAFSLQVPFSRVPTGHHTLTSIPSLIDYAAGTKGFVNHTSLHWDHVPADHALLGVSCTPVYVMRAAAKTRWKCIDDNKCSDWMRQLCPQEFD